MNEWQPAPEPIKSVSEILAGLFDKMNEYNVQFALGVIQHDEWTAEMRLIDQKLSIFGFRLDHPERFAAKVGRV